MCVNDPFGPQPQGQPSLESSIGDVAPMPDSVKIEASSASRDAKTDRSRGLNNHSGIFGCGLCMIIADWASKVKTDAKLWCAGRAPYLRIALLAYLSWVFFQLLNHPDGSSIFKGLDLGLHELGHILFSPFGEYIQVAGGSLFQCLVPLIAMAMFYRQRDYFAIAFAFGWLSVNLFDVASYAADASAMELPLVTPFKGGEVIHDWNYLLAKAGILSWDRGIAEVLRALGDAAMLVCLCFGIWLILQMVESRKAAQPTT